MCKISQRFAADKALQLLQSIAIESSDGEYCDSKSDEVSNAIADIQNEEDSSDSDYKYTNHEAPINTDDGARARTKSVNDEQILLSKERSQTLPSHCRTTTAAQYC